jgi:hypothetical protein
MTQPGQITLDTLTEILKAMNKDTLGAFRGEHKTQGASIQATMGAYLQIGAAAQEIVDTILKRDPKPPVLLLQAGSDVTELAELRAFQQRAGALGTRLQEEIDRADALLGGARTDALAFGPVLVAAASAALSLGALLLRRDVTVTHGAVAIEDGVLVEAVNRRLRKNGTHDIEVLPPTQIALLTPDETDETALPARLRAIEDLAQRLRGLLARAERALAAKPDDPQLAELKARIDAAVKSFEAFATSVAAVAGRLLRADGMRAKLGEAGLVLALRVLAAGGETRVEVRTGSQDLVEHYAGAIVSYVLFDAEGRVVDSGVPMHYAGARPELGPGKTLGVWIPEEPRAPR